MFLADMGLTEAGLDRVIHAGYKLLGLETFFTAGPKEVRAWTVQARQHRAAGGGRDPHRFRARIHPRGGDRATPITSPASGEQGAKEAGKMRLEGREYVVQDGDVMHFRFNV